MQLALNYKYHKFMKTTTTAYKQYILYIGFKNVSFHKR